MPHCPKSSIKEREFRRSILNGEGMVFSDKTIFRDFVDQTYLTYARNNNQSYETKVYEANRLKEFFGDYRIKAITPKLIEEFKKERVAESVKCQKCKHKIKHECEGKPLSPSTVNRELTTLSKIFSLAVQNRKLNSNPMQFVPKLQEPPYRERFLTTDEKEKLFVVLQANKQLFSLVRLALLTGWRRGQILKLEKASLRESGRLVTLPPSKKSPGRTVPVSSIVWEILQELADQTDKFLFVNKKTGQQLLDPDQAWNTACDSAGIKGLRFHDLRRTFAVDMLELNNDSSLIKKVLGHSTIRMTEIYAQHQDSKMRTSLDALAESEKIHHSAISRPSSKNAH